MDKYVKVINEYEILTEAELNKYSNKELTLLYVQKNTIHFDQDFFNKVIVKIFNNDTISFSDKIMTSHEQVSQLLKNIGVTEDLANLTKESVELTTKLLEKNDKLSNYFQKLNNMGEYPSKLYTLQTMIGSSLLRKMTWTSQQTMYKLTLASFLQAIYLDNVDLIVVKNYKDLLSKHFSQRDIEFFKEHPIKTKNILLNFKDIPPDIDKLILEQYEAPTGDGFPKKIGATSISPLSAIFILAGIISKYILDNPKEFAYERMMNELDNQGYSKGNFKEIYKKIPIIFNN